MSNRIETLEVLINSQDPKNSIKISNDSEASREIIYTQLDKVSTRIILNQIDHATGVITKGVQLASGENITAFIKSTDYSTNFFTFGSFAQETPVSAVTGVANIFQINVKNDDTALNGDYVIIPAVTAAGVETNHLFWFNNNETGFPPTGLDYVYHPVSITGTGSTNASNLAGIITAMNEFTATANGSVVTVTAQTAGGYTTAPEVSDSTTLGVSVTQKGRTAVPAQYAYTGLATGQTMSFTTGEQEKEAKILIEINNSGGTEQKTIARQDCTVIRSA